MKLRIVAIGDCAETAINPLFVLPIPRPEDIGVEARDAAINQIIGRMRDDAVERNPIFAPMFVGQKIGVVPAIFGFFFPVIAEIVVFEFMCLYFYVFLIAFIFVSI